MEWFINNIVNFAILIVLSLGIFQLSNEINKIDKELAIIKTILIMSVKNDSGN